MIEPHCRCPGCLWAAWAEWLWQSGKPRCAHNVDWCVLWRDADGFAGVEQEMEP